ncbi:hypothetical protein [Aquipuribacter sp. MA13-6]|uniref:hypothetical protein n=1 Tax=unclassified Aquipuribacter TaxID=2635084 RepID=UPI003EEFD7D7
MAVRAWPAQDQDWVARYRRAVAGRHVPADALEARERELLEAAHEAGVHAAELFGDAVELASEDAAELATVEEAVRTSEGGGLRPALREVGGSLVGVAVIAVLLLAVRGGWRVDVGVGAALVAVSVVVVLVGWRVGRALLSAGRPGSTVGGLVAVGALAVAGVAAAAGIGPDPVALRDVPVPWLGVALLAPGVLALVVADRMPQQVLRDRWDDTEWLRRFRGGLRSRLVPAATARGHVAEVEHALRAGFAPAAVEFGHPVVLARRLAEADRTARTRRWWVSTVTGTVTPLAVAAAIVALDSGGGVLTAVFVVLLLLSAAVTVVVGWGDRPWAGRR